MLTRLARRFLVAKGYSVDRATSIQMTATSDLDSDAVFTGIYSQCAPFTMTSKERMYANYQAARYITENRVGGAFVECGVWRGGSTMLMALTLLSLNERDRSLYLYDTFDGMVEPTAEDRAFDDRSAPALLSANGLQEMREWCNASLDEVRTNLATTGYPMQHVVSVKGRVEDTIPGTVPAQIALLRLDTDWYESTLHELRHLYPRISDGGVLIVDDYGYWKGARAATDQYFAENGFVPLLARIDNTGRIAVKTSVHGGSPRFDDERSTETGTG